MIEKRELGDAVIEQKINQFFAMPSLLASERLVEWDIVSLFWISLLRSVLCLHFPQLLSSPELRPYYPMHTMRVLIQCLIVGAILFGSFLRLAKKRFWH